MSSANDFDFIHGPWSVQHRRLAQRLAGCTDWQVFGGSCRSWPLLGGAGNVDDNLIDLPGGPYRAATLRSWDPAARTWQIWWLDARRPGGIGVPMVGRFEGGIGTFFADDSFEGRPIRVRFLWTRCDTPSPRWEQAFSGDGGQTWETNWTMDFTPAA
ncbi:MAG: DUF1579 domain-containing protein [Rubrivivax sp.]|nr:DUF1579 domain-containing protein [Rubrivivax sp.]